MSDLVWLKLKSWHVLRDPDFTTLKTVCGKTGKVGVMVANELPLSDRSCESCLRLTLVERKP